MTGGTLEYANPKPAGRTVSDRAERNVRAHDGGIKPFGGAVCPVFSPRPPRPSWALS